jgi:hypothetical protein
MNRQFHLKTVLLGASILLAFAYIGGLLIAKERLADLRSELLVQISEQRSLLATITETTARNGADEITERIVKDCTLAERTEFDLLLGRLNDGLSKAELTALERLFGRCGSFYAERKSVMAARFEREVEVYENYVSQLERIGGTGIEDFNVSLWKELAASEQMQSTEFGLLAQNQDKIISSLLEGKSAISPEIKTILEEVKKIQLSLTEASASASEKRTALDAL